MANGNIVIAVTAQATNALQSSAATVTVTKDTTKPTITISGPSTLSVNTSGTLRFTLVGAAAGQAAA